MSCRLLCDRTLLWRVIRLADGGIGLDQGMGRSAYLCPSHACLDEARRRKRLQRALRCQVADGVLDALDRRLSTSGSTPEAASEAR